MMLEFKHFTRAEGERLGVANWSEAPAADVAQVTRYAADLKAKYPDLTVCRYLLYTVGCAAFRFFSLD
jgi:hypothetical protein